MNRRHLAPAASPLLALLLGAALLGSVWSPEARAEDPSRIDTVYTSVAPADVGAILRELGVTYQQTTDSTGDPKYTFELRGYKAALVSYGCEDGRCQSLQMWAGFSMEEPPSLLAVNEWNRTKRFGRAYLDAENDPVLESDLDLEGGVSAEAIGEWIRTFGLLLLQFTEHIGIAK